MSAAPVDLKSEGKELKARRDLLFKAYLKHPHDINMSIEIKKMDDRIAEIAEQSKSARLAARASRKTEQA